MEHEHEKAITTALAEIKKFRKSEQQKKIEVAETVTKEQEKQNKDIEFIQKLNQAKSEAVRKVVEILNDRELIGLVDRDFMRSVQKDVINAANEIL